MKKIFMALLVAGVLVSVDAAAATKRKCPAGTYSDAGASICTQCKDNTISKEGATKCTACATGKTANAAHTACVDACPEHAKCASDGLFFICDDGYYENTSTKKCVTCPAGYYCTNGEGMGTYAESSSAPVGSSVGSGKK